VIIINGGIKMEETTDKKKVGKIDRIDAMLLLLSFGEGKPFSANQLDIGMFLVDQKLGDKYLNNRYNFRPEKYGPYDIVVNIEVEELVQDGSVKRTERRKGYKGFLAFYRIKPAGVRESEKILERTPPKAAEQIKKIAEFVLSKDDLDLIYYIAKNYPEMGKYTPFAP